jgi:hypothetical protein
MLEQSMDIPFTAFYLKETFKQFAAENPMKLYSGLFILGDALTASYGAVVDSPLWGAAATVGLITNGNKFLFGKGGEKIASEDVQVSIADAAAFAKDTAIFAAGVFSKDYFDDVCRHLSLVDTKEVLEKVKHIPQFWRYPLDAGWAAVSAAGGMYMMDALDMFGFRHGEQSLSQAFMGAAVTGGAALGFLTGNNNIAGRLLTFASAPMLYAGVADQQWLLAASVPFYLTANYIISKVKTENQSSYTMAQKEHPSP